MTFANAKSEIKSKIAKLATRSTFTKSLLAVAGAGALLLAAPAKSEAQVVFSAAWGGPAVTVAPAYNPYYNDYYTAQRRRAYIEHEEWLREHRYDRDYFNDRDHRDRDRYDRDRRDHDRYDRDRR